VLNDEKFTNPFINPGMRKVCENIMALAPNLATLPPGIPHQITDIATGQSYAYDKDELWGGESMSWSDLEFLHHLQHGFTLFDQEKWRESTEEIFVTYCDRLSRSDEIKFYLHIRRAYFCAVANLLDAICVDGLCQEQWEEPEERFREERNNIIWDRLVAMQLPIKEGELEELDVASVKSSLDSRTGRSFRSNF
jgi:hypothetical protein